MIADAMRENYRRAKWALVLRGLIGIVLGVLILVHPLASIAAFALVIALWALFDGIVRVVQAFELKSVMSDWWLLLVGGVVGILFGIAALYFYPALSLTFAVVWIAIWLTTTGAIGAYVGTQERRAGLSSGWTLTWGIIGIIVGILSFIYPAVTLAVLMGLIAIFGIVGGIAMLVGAGRLERIERNFTHAAHAAGRD